jgi:hypothetical protein
MTQLETKMPAIKAHGGKREHAGRPVGSLNKISKPVRELASAFGEEAIATLAHLMHHAETEQVRLAASNSLLDRGFGKPAHEEAHKEEICVVVNR